LPRSGRGPLPRSLLDAVERLNAELNGHGRVLVRPSGTEPLVRVLAEAPTEEESEALCGRVVRLVREELG
jgi:phosphoglucosamine mutase